MEKEIKDCLSKMSKSFGNHEKWVKDYQCGKVWLNEAGIVRAIQPYLKKCDNLLEIAVGYGRFSKHLFPYAQKFYGIDLNQCCIDYCRNNFSQENIWFDVCDGISIPYADCKFDIIISLDSLVHVVPGIIEAYIEQSLRLLNSSGVIIMHHASIGESVGARSHVFNRDVDQMVGKYGARLVARENLWYLPEKNLYNDAISIISK